MSIFMGVMKSVGTSVLLEVGGNPGGPQVDAQPCLQSDESRQLREPPAVDDVDDAGVVNAGETPDLASGAAADCLVEVEGEESYDLDFDTARARVRPIGYRISRRDALGTAHPESLRRPYAWQVSPRQAIAIRAEAAEIVGAMMNDGSYQQLRLPRLKALTVSQAIDGYQPDPREIPRDHWKAIGTFVRETVATFEARSVQEARRFLYEFSRYAHWCWLSAAYPLEVSVLLRRDVIGAVVPEAFAGKSVRTQQSVRSMLFYASNQLMPPEFKHVIVPALYDKTPEAPYTPEQVDRLIIWAGAQATDSKRTNALMLLSLGLGAGLSAAELCAVRGCDIEATQSGHTIVHVRGERQREVPLLTDWALLPAAVAAAMLRKQQWLFTPARSKEVSRSAVSNFVAKTIGRPSFPIMARRLRATWIVGHLNARVPAQVVATAAGLRDLDALSPYLPHLDGLKDNERIDLLTRAGAAS